MYTWTACRSGIIHFFEDGLYLSQSICGNAKLPRFIYDTDVIYTDCLSELGDKINKLKREFDRATEKLKELK